MTLDTNAKVEQIKRVIDSAGAVVAPATEQLQQTIRDSLANQDGLTAFEFTTGGSTAEQLPANAVPDGVTVLLQARDANGQKVYVGNDTAQPIEMQPAGTVALDVTDTSHIWVKGAAAGETVGVLYEDG
ncbi:hypothetical protein [Haloarcula onubensis]|uniref:Uncharacterized protein n=1 Tax=Haloarcula onubensis TaxID=2950539 RepID=A0ABU2FIR2_9EURY|nr:hypothetical protein [Halomicroarcula sp. S3CR25-11]MDS0280634.1 hypothetical protein [Halomicroarcula sp. S3CR25-11]